MFSNQQKNTNILQNQILSLLTSVAFTTITEDATVEVKLVSEKERKKSHYEFTRDIRTRIDYKVSLRKT